MKSIIPSPAAASLRRLLAPLLLSTCVAGPSAPVFAHACERPAQLKFSVIPQGGMQQDIASLQPLLDALEDALQIPVMVVESRSYGAVMEGMLAGAVDLARLGPASYIAAKRQDRQITAFASYARSADIFNQDGASYRSLLLVNARSAYSDLRALRGRKVALVDPDSTSGALIPRHMVKRETHMRLEHFFGQVVYTGNHRDSMQALLRDEVPAAFVSSSHLSDLVAAGKVSLSDVRILWRSALIPRDPFVYRGQLCKDIKKKITATFLKQDGRHYASLLNNLNATRFLPVSDKDYQSLRFLHSSK